MNFNDGRLHAALTRLVGVDAARRSTRRVLLITLGAGALAAPLACFAQQPAAKIRRIGVIEASAEADATPAFTEGLRELGWIEGKNITVERRQLKGNFERLPGAVSELVALNLEAIVASSNAAIAALRGATQTIPIVMSVVGDPVGSGFVASLAHPGGNVTGLSSLPEILGAKRLEILKEINPKASRVAVLRNPAIPSHAKQLAETEAGARALALTLLPVDMPTPDSIEAAFASMVKQRADGLIVLPDPIGISRKEIIVGLAARHGLPAVYPFGDFVEAGGLAAYGPTQRDLWRRSAGYVDRILRGAKPSELPVEQPTRFELLLNAKAAKALGIRIPRSVLVRADRVIE